MSLSTRTPDLSTLQHLPEMTRDSIARGLSDIRLPDLTSLERPMLNLPEFDVPKTITAVATAVGLVKPARPRWPFVLAGAVALGIASWVAVNRTMLRVRLDELASTARSTMRGDRRASDEALAFPAAATAPIQDPGHTNGTGADYPDGLGDREAVPTRPVVEASV
jgi:hypothetical protein